MRRWLNTRAEVWWCRTYESFFVLQGLLFLMTGRDQWTHRCPNFRNVKSINQTHDRQCNSDTYKDFSDTAHSDGKTYDTIKVGHRPGNSGCRSRRSSPEPLHKFAQVVVPSYRCLPIAVFWVHLWGNGSWRLFISFFSASRKASCDSFWNGCDIS